MLNDDLAEFERVYKQEDFASPELRFETATGESELKCAVRHLYFKSQTLALNEHAFSAHSWGPRSRAATRSGRIGIISLIPPAIVLGLDTHLRTG